MEGDMDISTIRAFLGWCAILNIGLLLWWFVMFACVHDWVYKVHSRWFKVSVERFDAIHYAGMGIFKMAIFVFNVVPYFALRIIGR